MTTWLERLPASTDAGALALFTQQFVAAPLAERAVALRYLLRSAATAYDAVALARFVEQAAPLVSAEQLATLFAWAANGAGTDLLIKLWEALPPSQQAELAATSQAIWQDGRRRRHEHGDFAAFFARFLAHPAERGAILVLLAALKGEFLSRIPAALDGQGLGDTASAILRVLLGSGAWAPTAAAAFVLALAPGGQWQGVADELVGRCADDPYVLLTALMFFHERLTLDERVRRPLQTIVAAAEALIAGPTAPSLEPELLARMRRYCRELAYLSGAAGPES